MYALQWYHWFFAVFVVFFFQASFVSTLVVLAWLFLYSQVDSSVVWKRVGVPTVVVCVVLWVYVFIASSFSSSPWSFDRGSFVFGLWTAATALLGLLALLGVQTALANKGMIASRQAAPKRMHFFTSSTGWILSAVCTLGLVFMALAAESCWGCIPIMILLAVVIFAVVVYQLVGCFIEQDNRKLAIRNFAFSLGIPVLGYGLVFLLTAF